MRAKLFSISELDYFRGIFFLNIYSYYPSISLNTFNFQKKKSCFCVWGTQWLVLQIRLKWKLVSLKILWNQSLEVEYLSFWGEPALLRQLSCACSITGCAILWEKLQLLFPPLFSTFKSEMLTCTHRYHRVVSFCRLTNSE